ncbi:MAG TPA: tetratricopeptide repeat protein [Candidatus Limnocylindrales bacterium]|jgi:tetratricopeptide (TPR) repeat protein
MSNTKTIRLERPGAPTDKTLNRLIGVLIAIIAIGLPAIGVIYYLDRHVDAGPSITGRAVITAEEAVRQYPNQLETRVVLAQAYAADDRPADAIAQYTIILGAEPVNTTALLGRGDLYRKTGQLGAAASDYQALIDVARDTEMANIDRALQSAYYGLGLIAMTQGRPDDAATQLANSLRIDRTDADALDLMGQALIAIGDYETAVEALRDAVAFVPTGWVDPYTHLAQAYEGLADQGGVAYANGMVALNDGRLDDADAALQPLVGGSHSRDALIGLGLTAEQRGDAAAAADFYRRVLAVVPDDFAALSGLSRVGVPATAPLSGSTP